MMATACSSGGNGNGNNNQPPPPPPPTVGLDARPSNLSCVAPARATVGTIDVADAFPGLPNISFPTRVLVEPGANPRWFVLSRGGQVFVFDPANANALTQFLDIRPISTSGEGGLLGMAFHPDFPATPEVFLSYTQSSPFRSVISRFVLDNVTTPGAGTLEQVIIEIDQFASNHNGGDIAFGPDGFLYIGLGDGGGSNDPNNTGQDTTNLLGAMLRIDVDGTGAGYLIPPGNPFSGNAMCGPTLNNANDCPEIYAWGLRNPWRWSFDAPTGELWLGDVGQGAREEVDLIVNGGNYGWDCREGFIAGPGSNCTGSYVDPVSDYGRSEGRSITGGYVYRGSSIPGLFGRYVFGDFETGRIWALADDGAGGYTNEQLVVPGINISSFAIDPDGEVYFTDFFGGRIMQIIETGAGNDPISSQLSASGCVDPADVTAPYAGLVPYGINAPFWSDGAVKDRHVGLPNGSAISIDGNDDWQFPPGTVLVKNFRLNGRLVETRHLMRHPDGVWAGYTYEWNATESEATRVQGGKVSNIDGQDWIFPDEAECLGCHTAVAGRALGLETAQMNRDFTYPQTGRTHNQLETFDVIAMFDTPLAGDPATLPAMPDPFDMSADRGDRARAYLHTNCAQCHQPNGPTSVDIDLRYTTALANTMACNVPPTAGDLGINMAQLIAPGDAARSVLVARMDRRDVDGMPPLASNLVDAAGVTLVSDWVNGLVNCN